MREKLIVEKVMRCFMRDITLAALTLHLFNYATLHKGDFDCSCIKKRLGARN